MKFSKIFMTGNWENLIISTFEVDKLILEPYLPNNVEIDFYNGKALLSSVAFTFSKVRFFGIKVPFHQEFGQLNFRFYVKSKIDGTPGVVFIKEFAPKPLIAFVANTIYNEPYHYKNIKRIKTQTKDGFKMEYNYSQIKINTVCTKKLHKPEDNSLEKFVVDRYVAFIKSNSSKSYQYKINHKPWKLYETETVSVDQNILSLLPKEFGSGKLLSSYFVDGSSVTVQKGILQGSESKNSLCIA